jgi:hypothetical protein
MLSELDPEEPMSLRELKDVFGNLPERLQQVLPQFASIHEISPQAPGLAGALVQTEAHTAIIKNPPDELGYSEFTFLLHTWTEGTPVPIELVLHASSHSLQITCDEGETVEFTLAGDILRISYEDKDGEHNERLSLEGQDAELTYPYYVVDAVRHVATALDLLEHSTKELPYRAKVRTLSLDEYRNIKPVDELAEELSASDVLAVFNTLFAQEPPSLAEKLFKPEQSKPREALAKQVFDLRRALTSGIQSIRNISCVYTYAYVPEESGPNEVHTVAFKILEKPDSPYAVADYHADLTLEYLDYFPDDPKIVDRRANARLNPEVAPSRHLIFNWHTSGVIEIAYPLHDLYAYYFPETGAVSFVRLSQPDNERMAIRPKDAHEKLLLSKNFLPVLSMLAGLQELPAALRSVINNKNRTRKILTD